MRDHGLLATSRGARLLENTDKQPNGYFGKGGDVQVDRRAAFSTALIVVDSEQVLRLVAEFRAIRLVTVRHNRDKQ